MSRRYASAMTSSVPQPPASFGARLKELRLAAGMTQRQLSEVAGVDHSQIGRYEKDDAVPRPGVLVRLAAALSTTLEYLRRGETEEDSIAALENTLGGRLVAMEALELSQDEYRDLLAACEISGLSLPEMVRLAVLEGMKEFRNRPLFDDDSGIPGTPELPGESQRGSARPAKSPSKNRKSKKV